MSKQKLEVARALIKEGNLKAAREVLNTIRGDKTAQKWIAEIDRRLGADPFLTNDYQKPKKRRASCLVAAGGVVGFVGVLLTIAMLTPNNSSRQHTRSPSITPETTHDSHSVITLADDKSLDLTSTEIASEEPKFMASEEIATNTPHALGTLNAVMSATFDAETATAGAPTLTNTSTPTLTFTITPSPTPTRSPTPTLTLTPIPTSTPRPPTSTPVPLIFSGNREQVLGPIDFPAGVYRAVVFTEGFIIVAISPLSGECGKQSGIFLLPTLFNVFEGEARQGAEAIFVSRRCSALIAIENLSRPSWRLSFERIQ
jgi:hypothetical protein